MRPELEKARDEALAVQDAAVAVKAARPEADFLAAMNDVVVRLRGVIADVEPQTRSLDDRVELSKTYRWLGDAYFEIGRICGRQAWQHGANAYVKSQHLLEGITAPIEQAKLAFNFGNTMAMLSEGTNVGLMEAADTLYQSALAAFRTHHLTGFVRMVEQRQATLRAQLKPARALTDMQRRLDRMQGLAERLDEADGVEHREIAAEAPRLPGSDEIEDLKAAITAVMKEAGAASPPAEVMAKLNDAMQVLAAAAAARPVAEPSADAFSDIAEKFAGLIRDRLRAQQEAGIVSPARASQVANLLKKFLAARPKETDDVRTHEQKVAVMKDLFGIAADMARTPSLSRPSPMSGTRASRTSAVVSAMRDYLLSEVSRSMVPQEESYRNIELYGQSTQLQDLISGTGDDQENIVAAENQVWRFALDVQRHARRYHLVVARPALAMLAAHVSPRSLFLSGTQALTAAAGRLAEADGLELMLRPSGGDIAQPRWSQLLSASIGVFDIGLGDGAERMQVFYELGWALALGKACVVVVRPGTNIPFDVEGPPITFQGDDAQANASTLRKGLYDALSRLTEGGRVSQSVSGNKAALAEIERDVRSSATDNQLSMQLRLARTNVGDTTALIRSLEHIANAMGAGGPAILLPTWPPALVQVADRPRCFHVTSFSKTWSESTTELVAETCRRRGWEYVRGDNSPEQRIMRGIWKEIVAASAVVVDVTDYNPNVGLELGLVHALGRPCKVIAQGRDPEYMFPSLAKTQTHRYGSTPPHDNLAETVGSLLAGLSARSMS